MVLPPYETNLLEREIMNEIINNSVLWLICSVTVFIVALQAGLFVRLALRNAQSFGLSREKCFKAFRIGMVTAFGPSLGILIVMVGLMTVLGEPLTWMRLSMIVSAANELTAAQIGAQAVGIEFNSPDFGTAALFIAWFGMAINGIGSLVETLAFSGSLEKMKEKINAYNPKILLFVSVRPWLRSTATFLPVKSRRAVPTWQPGSSAACRCTCCKRSVKSSRRLRNTTSVWR